MRWYKTEDGPVNNGRTARGRILRNHFWLTMGSIRCGEVKDAMNRVKRKLKNQTGASITFALLLFLVCAVLSSVIIVAATAASGRMSKIAETDQRYYAVTSAAVLLKDMIADPDKPISIVEVEERTKITTYHEDGSVTYGVYSDPPKLKAVYLVEKPANQIHSEEDCSGGTQIDGDEFTLDPMYKFDSIQKDAAYHVYYKDTGSVNKKFSMTSGTVKTAVGSENDPLSVTIYETIQEDGSLKLKLNNTNGEQPYVLTLTLSTDKSEFEINKEVDDEPVIYSDDSYSIKTTKTTLKITGLSWSFLDLKVGDTA